MVTLYNDDCLVRMRDIPDKSIDMVLCDLPYGVTQNKMDVVIPFDRLWEQYDRIVKDNGVIALFAQGLFYVDLVNSNRSMFRYDLVWDKVLISGFLNANKMPLRSHEQIAIFYKNIPVYNPQMTIGNPSHTKGTKHLTVQCSNNNYGNYKSIPDTRPGDPKKYPVSILSFRKPHPSVAKHRTEKPTELLEYLIKTYTNEGYIVLDNCMGSGSTGVACVNTNRDFIGIEIDKSYFDIANDRINNTIREQKSRLW